MSFCTFSNCALEDSGPMVVSSALGSPTFTLSAAALAMFTASSYFERGTSMREGALQDWPVLFIIASTPPPTAVFKSASSRMTFADLPPSSSDTRLTVSEAAFETWIPARVEPVNDIMSMPGCAAMAAPTSGPVPSTRLNTPLGTPASCKISARMCALSGATSLGFSTIVQPDASAGAILQQIWLAGQFQGVIKPQTPA